LLDATQLGATAGARRLRAFVHYRSSHNCSLCFLSHHTVVWGIFCLLCVILSFFVFFSFLCTVTDFSAVKTARGVKFCVCVGLLAGQAFSHFGGQRSRSPGTISALSTARPHQASVRMVCPVAVAALTDERICWRVRGDVGGGVQRGSELGVAASTKAE